MNDGASVYSGTLLCLVVLKMKISVKFFLITPVLKIIQHKNQVIIIIIVVGKKRLYDRVMNIKHDDKKRARSTTTRYRSA